MDNYKNSNLSTVERVKDLMSKMTIEEKVSQLTSAYAYGGNVDMTQLELGIGHIGMSSGTMTVEGNVELVNKIQKYLIEETRLGIPAIFHVETLNGGSLTKATTYPIPLGLASSFNSEAVQKMAECISAEMVATGQRMALAPVVDIARDPRWGRIGETYGESPTLTGALGAAYAKGIQGTDLKKNMSCCPKHFVGYAAGEGGLNIAGAHMGQRELREVHSKPFQAMINEAKITGVMNCYLAIDGDPMVSNREALTELLREQMGFEGAVIADYGSIDKLFEVFNITKDEVEAGVMALSAGLDLETPSRKCMNDELVERVKAGKVDEKIINLALERNLTLKFDLGLFENPFADLEKTKLVYQSDEAIELSYNLCCEGTVMLRNENDILPLKNIKKIAIIGPNGNNFRGLFGGYTYPAFYEGMRNTISGISKSMGLEGVTANNSQKTMLEQMLSQMPEVETLIKNNYKDIKTVFEGIKSKAHECDKDIEVRFSMGCDYLTHDKSGFREAIELAKSSDVVIFACGGKNGSAEGSTMGENVDDCYVGLPGIQEELAKELKLTGVPIVMLHLDGRPLSSVWASEEADAIIEAWHPGQVGGKAIADMIFGDVAPSGKLAITTVRHEGQIPIYAEQHRGNGMTGKGRTNSSIASGYLQDTGHPLYAFGFGKTYTTFKISDIEINKREILSNESVKISLNVTNIGEREGTEVVQLYVSDLISNKVRPIKELCGFKRVTLEQNETKNVEFELFADQLAIWLKEEKWVVEEGEIEVLIGNSSDNLEHVGIVNIKDSREFNGRYRHLIAK